MYARTNTVTVNERRSAAAIAKSGFLYDERMADVFFISFCQFLKSISASTMSVIASITGTILGQRQTSCRPFI